jgi:hypothetical protein
MSLAGALCARGQIIEPFRPELSTKEGNGSERIRGMPVNHRGGTVFYQIGKGLSRVRVREALRMMGLDPDGWMWMYSARSGVLRVF